MSSHSAKLDAAFATSSKSTLRSATDGGSPALFLVPLICAFALMGLRLNGTATTVLKEGNLTVVALIAYLSASVVFITHYLLDREPLLMKIGKWTMAFGYVMNFAGWGIRWIEYIDHAKAQPAIGAAWNSYPWTEKVSHTFPLNNLYDIGIAFTSIAVLASLIIASRKTYDFIGSVTMPTASLVLILAVFLESEITTLQPILRSYWRPIHVSLAAISYGVCLVSFGIALLYLLKDKVKIESMALWVALCGIAVYVTIGDFSVITQGSYGLGVRAMGSGLNLSGGGVLRADLPMVGNLIRLGMLLYLGAFVCLAMFVFMKKQAMQVWGNQLMAAALIGQVVVFGAIMYQMKAIAGTVGTHIASSQLPAFGAWLVKNSKEDPSRFAPQQLAGFGQDFLKDNAAGLSVSFASNPIELASIVTLIAATLFCVLFAFKGDRLLKNLPELETLDTLNYKTVSVCFPMLTMMLITGAVWANESWGTYWSWDPKETWALVTWLAYAAYLHSRIVHGWKGRSSAYFAVIGFLFVIFTYLGVSFLLPGLHSYAGVN